VISVRQGKEESLGSFAAEEQHRDIVHRECASESVHQCAEIHFALFTKQLREYVHSVSKPCLMAS
jgi:hypothetical protein